MYVVNHRKELNSSCYDKCTTVKKHNELVCGDRTILFCYLRGVLPTLLTNFDCYVVA